MIFYASSQQTVLVIIIWTLVVVTPHRYVANLASVWLRYDFLSRAWLPADQELLHENACRPETGTAGRTRISSCTNTGMLYAGSTASPAVRAPDTPIECSYEDCGSDSISVTFRPFGTVHVPVCWHFATHLMLIVEAAEVVAVEAAYFPLEMMQLSQSGCICDVFCANFSDDW